VCTRRLRARHSCGSGTQKGLRPRSPPHRGAGGRPPPPCVDAASRRPRARGGVDVEGRLSAGKPPYAVPRGGGLGLPQPDRMGITLAPLRACGLSGTGPGAGQGRAARRRRHPPPVRATPEHEKVVTRKVVGREVAPACSAGRTRRRPSAQAPVPTTTPNHALPGVICLRAQPYGDPEQADPLARPSDRASGRTRLLLARLALPAGRPSAAHVRPSLSSRCRTAGLSTALSLPCLWST
jgi:hypothetical protein